MAKPPPRAWVGFVREVDVPFEGPIVCSFCGQPQDDRRQIIAGPTPAVAICEDCVRLATDMFVEE